jgi:tripartite-type tricarboxylate transporter receptor subunit TctC
MMRAKRSLALVAALLVCPAVCFGQQYPSRMIRIVLPFPPGGGSDLVARVVAQKWSAAFGQSVIVDNKAGASGNIASEFVAKSAPDGYTLLFTNSSIALTPALFRNLSYDALRDLAPVSMASSYAQVLVVHPSLPVKSVRQLIDFAKARPGALHFSSAGAGTMTHLAMELFELRAGVRLTHVPYRGSLPATMAVIGGESQAGLIAVPNVQAQIKAGKLRALGIAAKTRARVIPDVPTMAEAGVPDAEALQWNGLFAPARTPQSILERLHRELLAALAAPEVKQRLEAEGAEAVGNSPEEFAAFFRAEAEKWADVVKRSGTSID